MLVPSTFNCTLSSTVHSARAWQSLVATTQHKAHKHKSIGRPSIAVRKLSTYHWGALGCDHHEGGRRPNQDSYLKDSNKGQLHVICFQWIIMRSLADDRTTTFLFAHCARFSLQRSSTTIVEDCGVFRMRNFSQTPHATDVRLLFMSRHAHFSTSHQSSLKVIPSS